MQSSSSVSLISSYDLFRELVEDATEDEEAARPNFGGGGCGDGEECGEPMAVDTILRVCVSSQGMRTVVVGRFDGGGCGAWR